MDFAEINLENLLDEEIFWVHVRPAEAHRLMQNVISLTDVVAALENLIRY